MAPKTAISKEVFVCEPFFAAIPLLLYNLTIKTKDFLFNILVLTRSDKTFFVCRVSLSDSHLAHDSKQNKQHYIMQMICGTSIDKSCYVSFFPLY